MKKNPDLVKFGLNVRRLRLKKGLSPWALAIKLDTPVVFQGIK